MSLIVTGCMKSGTHTAAKVFDLGFEQYFGSGDVLPDGPPKGEASWLAAPHVPTLIANGFSVIHIVRDPLHVVGSIEASGWWKIKENDHIAFIRRHAPEVFDVPDEGGLRSLAYWLIWNRKITKAGPVRIRLEDMMGASVLGHGSPRRISMPWTWGRFPSGDLVSTALKLAEIYGYNYAKRSDT